MARRPPMSEDLQKKCVALNAEGKTIKEIAEIIGYSHVTVRKVLNQNGIETPRKPRKRQLYYNNQDRKTMAALEWERGQTVPQIARSIKVHPQTVRGWIQQAGKYDPARDAGIGLTPFGEKVRTNLDEMRQKYGEGASVRDLAFEYDVDYAYLYEVLRRKGILNVRPQKRIGPFEFIDAWQSAENVAEVAEKFDLSLLTASNRASYYRTKGVPMKYMATHYDWQRLADFANQFAEEG